MFDATLRKLIDPPLAMIGHRLVATGLTANQMTMAGATLGGIAILALAWQLYGIALVCLVLNRLADGLDGAMARAKGPTDYGGYLDIVSDFLFYSGFVFGFIIADPDRNSIAGAFLMFSFVGTGITFLTFAILAAKRGISTQTRGQKSFYYMGGLAEGTETIIAMIAMCLWPRHFPHIAWIFAVLCWLTTISRLMIAKELFDDGKHTPDTEHAPVAKSENAGQPGKLGTDGQKPL